MSSKNLYLYFEKVILLKSNIQTTIHYLKSMFKKNIHLTDHFSKEYSVSVH